MSELQTRDLDFQGSALKVNGTTVISASGAFVGDVQAPTGSIGLTELSSGITPSHVVKFAGTSNWGGGGTVQAVTVTGVVASDVVQATLANSTNVVAFKAVPTTNTITWTFASDPGAGTVLAYAVLRAAA